MQKSTHPAQQVLGQLSQAIGARGRVWLTPMLVASAVIALRLGGGWQTLEFQTFDQLFRLRPVEPVDQRVVIVGIDEVDLRQLKQWPMTDAVLADLLRKVEAARPRAIGLDLYRDLVVAPGHSQLISAYQGIPSLIGIQQLPDHHSVGVAPPPVLAQLGRVGFNNVICDSDGKVRRSLLYWHADGQMHESFALKLALIYLKQEGITPKPAQGASHYLQLNQTVFPKFQSDDSVYVGADDGGYQILANFRRQSTAFQTVSLRALLAGQVDPAVLRDRIVLIGSTAVSLKDLFATPFDNGQMKTPTGMAGVEVQAHFISQVVSAALDQRPLLKSWAEPLDWIWIYLWAGVGTILGYRFRSPRGAIFAMGLAGLGLAGTCYSALLASWIIPLVPALIALSGAAIVVIGSLAHSQAELRRSQAFLHRIINSIPDPVFVKDTNHRLIALNQAYAQFLGRPLEDLLGKSDYDVFLTPQAETFWQQDQQVFEQQLEQEQEAEFTTSEGVTYHIATKRSLHQDAAGNLFLVGIIRDITQRKFREADLERTTKELQQSNAELRLSQDRLSYLANHDSLTGLPNRKCFYDRMANALAQANNQRQMLAVMFLDLDGFKQINDTLGHPIGDVLLQVVSKRLMGCLRSSDTVARFGGDEFVIILPSLREPEEAIRVADKILKTLSHGFVITGQKILVSTSIGISLYPEDGQEVEGLLDQADVAMYRAKSLGKNQYAFTALGQQSFTRNQGQVNTYP
jgi:diguanylate cyclase (GGDEF)-like protein/PAS domain S-box-containing protein